MRSLGAAEPAAGIEAMQLINRKVYRSVFMVLLMGMAPAGIVIAAGGISLLGGAAATWLMLGAALYLAGVVAVTGLGNVPMNQRLDLLDRHLPETRSYWRQYLRGWTRLNHLRTLSAALASLSYLMAIVSVVQAS